MDEDYSLETTVPTDLSLSPDETSDYGFSGDRRKRISKHLLERKQLLHDLQVLKIELSQKGLLVDNLKADHMQKVEELEEKLSDALHQKQILQARLESQLKIQQDDAIRRQEQIQKELDAILKKQHALESTNERLQEKAVDIRKSLSDVELTENQYKDLVSKDEDALAIKDFVAVKLYETVKPWKEENSEIKSRTKVLLEDLHKCKHTLERYKEDLLEEKRQHEDIQMKHQKVTLAYADVKSQVNAGDYKIENYDRVKSERDALEQESTDIKKTHAYLTVTNDAVTKERDELLSQVASQKQTIQLLEKDKDYFSKQVSDTHNKLLYTEEKLIQVNDQVDRAKQSREDLYDKYVASRDQYKTEYETKLREELEQIRVKTNSEIDRLKTSSKEMYERENRNLREARDLAISEKERAQEAERAANGKYEQLMQDFREQQMSTDNNISELRNEVKIKSFESERTQMVYEETVRQMKETQMENEKLNKKLEVLTKEYYTMQSSLERRSTEMETELKDKNIKLETYEKLEQELDDVVMQAAEVENEDDAEKVLFSYGYGANVPTTSKRRLKQSVHLARRVLQLERANTSMRKELEREQGKGKSLEEEVRNTNKLLEQSNQPYHYLVESVKVRDQQIAKQKDHIEALENDIGRLSNERSTLTRSKNQMATDLERLLTQKEEMAVMKQVMLNLSHRRSNPAEVKSARSLERTPRSSRSKTGSGRVKKTAVHQPKHTFEPAERDENVHMPPPTQFTSETPNWYKRLQQKGKMKEAKYGELH